MSESSSAGAGVEPPRPLRIAVVHNLPSGGAKRCMFEQVVRLAQRHQVEVLSLASADHEFCDLRPHVHGYTVLPFEPTRLFDRPLGRLNVLSRWRDLRRLDHAYSSLAAKIDSDRFDVVLVHPCQFMQAPSLLRRVRTPTLYYCHEPLRRCYESPPPRPYLERGTIRRLIDRLDPLPHMLRRATCLWDAAAAAAADRLLVNSHFTQRRVRKVYGLYSEVVYPGVDVTIFQPGPPDAPRKEGVLSVGALRANKGFDFLLEALARVAPSERPAMTIVSNGADPRERAYLEQLALQLGVTLRLEFDVDEAALVRCYRDAAVVLYAPVGEPLGFVPLEAMASGRAVVAVAEGGVLETVVDGATGLLVPRDAERFAEALLRLLRRPEERLAMGEAGRREVESRWDWDQSVAGIERHLLELAGIAPARCER